MKFNARFLMLFMLLAGCGLSSCGTVEDSREEKQDTLAKSKQIKSSYISTNFYQSENRITDASILAYNDLIMIAFRPYTDGSIYFDLPDNSAEFTSTDYMETYDHRNGVIDFKGETASMNAGADLL